MGQWGWGFERHDVLLFYEIFRQSRDSKNLLLLISPNFWLVPTLGELTRAFTASAVSR